MNNRWLLLTLTLSLLAFSVTAFGQTTVTVKFQLNTSTAVGVTDTASTLSVRGSVPPLDWGTAPFVMTSLGGDFWEATIALDTTGGATDLAYKYHHDPGDNWESVSDHTYDLTLGDTTLALAYFSADNTAPYTATDSIDVFFRVNVGSAYELDAFDGVEGVFIAGSLPPLAWGDNPIALTQETGDTMIWSGVVSFNDTMATKTLAYKFVLGIGPRSWEDLPGDRNVTIPAADSTVQWVFWEDTEATGEPSLTGNLLFTIDMNSYIETGAFDPVGGDIVRVVGGFQNWDNTSADVEMTDQGGGLYELLLPYEAVASTGNEYKFFLELDTLAHSSWLDLGFAGTFDPTSPSWWGWELPVDEGGGNRLFDWSGGNITLAAAGFNSIPAELVIPEGTSVDVTFSVEISKALVDPDAPFVVATDSIWVIFPEEMWTGLQGIDRDLPLNAADILTDSDGDGVYTRTVALTGPIHSGLTYFYQYHTIVGTNVVGEGGGFSKGRYRGRFVPGFTDGTWPATYSLPVDTLDPSGAPLEVEDIPALITVGIDNEGITPLSFALAQNYPNPFNPSTLISYTIPAISDVNITIYNLLGQQIFNQRTGNVQPGSYEFKWNGVDNSGKIMASGVYFYKLSAGSHSAVKKMVLLK